MERDGKDQLSQIFLSRIVPRKDERPSYYFLGKGVFIFKRKQLIHVIKKDPPRPTVGNNIINSNFCLFSNQ